MRRFDKKNNIRNANLLAEQRYLQSKELISENEGDLDDEVLLDNIENLNDSDIAWSKDPNKGLSITFDWDNVDEDLLLTQILNLIKKVNPNADLVKKKAVFLGSNILANFNSDLYLASQKSFSAMRGLKNYFKDNLYIFKNKR